MIVILLGTVAFILAILGLVGMSLKKQDDAMDPGAVATTCIVCCLMLLLVILNLLGVVT